jgi:N-acetylgalactosamine kinase
MPSHLVAQFKELTGMAPTHYIRVPGRVNLIGEHTDYNGLPVMPMAIERQVRLLLAPRTDRRVEIYNTAKRYEPRSFTISPQIAPYATGDWGNYIKAGVQGIVTDALNRGKALSEISGFSALIESDLPAAAGLSSSSALVVASALAELTVNRWSFDREELAEQMSAAERYVGTMGGGMDQAVILLAQAGSALKIDFFPLRITHVNLPPAYRVVICNSMIRAPKTAEARLLYNRLPIECRIATAVLARALSDRGVDDSAARISEILSVLSPAQVLEEAEKLFGDAYWTQQQVADFLSITSNEVAERYMRLVDGSTLPTPTEGFPLLRRIRHVVTEGQRVEDSVTALSAGDAIRFGELMNASHASCRDDYGISCPALDELVRVARSAGAVGSRLTGAGFGGCTVNLVHRDKVESFVDTVVSQYYARYLKETHPELFSGYRPEVLTMWLSSDPLSKELRFSLCVNDPTQRPMDTCV